jgi:RHH-type proline utilization regulon transcriptional repressor/proline dehydrogenase/delta 1-pyrroline-5-carboxylate dehydrogenase
LAYLVRRLLENGANTSFVNRIADESIALDELVRDPWTVDAGRRRRRRGCAAPSTHSPTLATVRTERRNSAGLDLASEPELAEIEPALQDSARQPWQAGPMLACKTQQLARCTRAQPRRPQNW